MNTQDIIYRSAVIDDVAQMAELDIRCFSDPWSEDSFRDEIQKNHLAEYIVAELNGEIIGYIGMWFIVDEGHITNVAVSPDYRGLGIGKEIVGLMLEYGYGEGVLAVTLEVRASNVVAQNLYTSYGFKPAGVRKGYYQDNGEDAIIMWLTKENE